MSAPLSGTFSPRQVGLALYLPMGWGWQGGGLGGRKAVRAGQQSDSAPQPTTATWRSTSPHPGPAALPDGLRIQLDSWQPRARGQERVRQVFKRPLREAAAPILESYSAGAEPPELLPESLQGPCHFEITRGLNKRAETQPRPGQAGRLLPVSLKNR